MPNNIKSLERHFRHIELKNFDAAGQEKIQKAEISIVGMGGLGCPSALYLAGAGIGKIQLIDSDTVEFSNLQRQLLYTPKKIGSKKCNAAAEYLKECNPDIEVAAVDSRINAENIESILQHSDLILDATDNFDTRYLLNRYCLRHDKTLVSGAVTGFNGQLFVFKKNSPCLECIFPKQPTSAQAPSCNEAPVLSTIAGTIGMMMATEAIKEIVGFGDSLSGKCVTYNGLNSTMHTIEFPKTKNCPACNAQ